MEAKAWVDSATSYPGRLELEVNFSTLMVQGGRQASQLHAPVFALQVQNRQHQAFAPTRILNCKPCTNLHNKYFLTKQSNGDVVSSQDPETPCPCHLHPTGTPRSQTYFSCPRSKALFAKTSQRGCFSRVIRNIRLQDTEVPTQDQLRTWSQNYSTQWAIILLIAELFTASSKG